jgi:hypothetical protein
MDPEPNTPAQAVYFAFVMLAEAVYIFVVVALIVNRNVPPFNSSFFTLWINLGITDCLLTITTRTLSKDFAGVDWITMPQLKGGNQPQYYWVCVCKNETDYTLICTVFSKSRSPRCPI